MKSPAQGAFIRKLLDLDQQFSIIRRTLCFFVDRKLMHQREFRLGVILFFVLVVVRVLMIAGITWLTGGSEFTSDTGHLASASQPGYIILGTTAQSSYFPPLLPVMLWAFITPWQTILPDFAALRAGYATVELAAWPLIWALIVAAIDSPRWRLITALLFILAPFVWTTSIIMAQEDILNMLFAAAVCLLVLRERFGWACAVAGMGVVCAKIFFLVPIFMIGVLAMDRSLRTLVRCWTAGLAPVVCCYGIAGFFWWKNGIGFPLAGFHPPLLYVQSIWLLLDDWFGLSVAFVYPASAGLALLLLLTIAFVLWRRPEPFSPREINAAWGLAVLAVFCSFYESMAEYFVLVLPPMLFALTRRSFAAVTLLVLSLPWVVNFFFGIQNARIAGSVASDSIFLRLYDIVFSWAQPNVLKQITLVAFVVLSWGLCVMLLRGLLQRAQAPEPSAAGPAAS